MVHRATHARGYVTRPLAVAVAILIVLVIAAPASAKPKSGICSLYPGDTNLSWKSAPQTTSIDLNWVDADGNVVSAITIVPTKAMHYRYSQQTPIGAAEFGATFSDASGPFAVTGLVCT
jgi:hypothetical protein